ncbi:hypothetical protein C0995_008909 [Termitomyces sp. Mi166|nr:hypothetical protein C0995_008909 [Termitomyces sp. Mi166\
MHALTAGISTTTDNPANGRMNDDIFNGWEDVPGPDDSTACTVHDIIDNSNIVKAFILTIK